MLIQVDPFQSSHIFLKRAARCPKEPNKRMTFVEQAVKEG
jgi:hypothetical protein